MSYMAHPVEELGNFPQIRMNSIDEKLVIEIFPNNVRTWVDVRRLLMDYSDSGEELWEENREVHENLPEIIL